MIIKLVLYLCYPNKNYPLQKLLFGEIVFDDDSKLQHNYRSDKFYNILC
jgi:hypothetical protein